MILIARHQEGISLNDYEYVLEEEGGDIKLFNSVEDAMKFLSEAFEVECNNESEWFDKAGIIFINEEDIKKD